MCLAWALCVLSPAPGICPVHAVAFPVQVHLSLSRHALAVGRCMRRCSGPPASGAAMGVSSSGDKVSYVCDVFIEDTDCFGVVYNANYLRFFDRARQDALGVQQLAALQRDLPRSGGGLYGGQYLRLVENREIKLSGSAVLGQQIEVLSSFEPVPSDDSLLQWKQTLACKENGTVLASSDATTFLGPATTSPALETCLHADKPRYECEHTVWADDIDARGQLSDVSILKLMERNRNTALGGASDLARLQAEGCLIVVTHINNLKVDLGQCVQLGDRLQVRSTGDARKFKFTFRQEIMLPGASTPLAQAQVTCFSIDSASKKPSSPPKWVLEGLGLV